jgi:hypothetical protein
MNTPTSTPETAARTIKDPTRPARDDAAALMDVALQCAAKLRHGQLRDLPDAGGDPVVAAQRTALLQTLTDIAAARERVVNGTYGRCVHCGDPIPPGRLEFRPWAATCMACVNR